MNWTMGKNKRSKNNMQILIAGGYGLIGRTIARHIRTISKDIEITLAGRNPENGESLVQEIENAKIMYLDLDNKRSVEKINWKQFDLIISALADPADILIYTAI